MDAATFLSELGRKLRAHRQLAGLSQKRLAELAGLSPRYVSQLESGQGNISIMRLYELTQALGVALDEVVRVETRTRMIALIGLRGAGKSTVGHLLAAKLGRRFVELDALIEEQAGLGLAEIFELHGERYYRRLEREVLSRFLAAGGDAILAAGGSLVSDAATYQLLKTNAMTVWLKARPELHLERVAAQGDGRPMAGRADPLAELRTLLDEREPLYREAELVVDTSTLHPDAVIEEILGKIA
jgi:XRE family aerobic/anaerobic benzoate catabolism transcriptional regulator